MSALQQRWPRDCLQRLRPLSTGLGIGAQQFGPILASLTIPALVKVLLKRCRIDTAL